jgi:transcriptional regulator with XRE-family HTH domain
MFYDAYLELCNNIGKSPTAVGKILEISQGTISTWKSGKSKPTDKLIYKIAEYFKVDFKELKEGRVVPVQSETDNIQTAITDWMKEEEQRMKETKEFAIKYSQLDDRQKALVSELIDTLLEKRK